MSNFEIKEAVKRLEELIKLRKNKCGEIKFDTCICGTKDLETVLQALKKYRRLAEANLRDSEEVKNNMCEHKGILKSELPEFQENSMLKKKIEDKIKWLDDDGYWEFLELRDLYKTKNILQELLEKN